MPDSKDPMLDTDTEEVASEFEDPNVNINSSFLFQDSGLILPNDGCEQKQMLQQKLWFYFLSALDKWRFKRRLPFKLLFQLLKIVFVTCQLVYFGNQMSNYLSQEDNMSTAFKEVLLDSWDTTREVVSYPPANGIYAIYTTEHFYTSLDYAIRRYSNISKLSVGSFGFIASENSSQEMPVVIFERSSHSERKINSSQRWFRSNSAIEHKKLIVADLYPPGDGRWFSQFNCLDYFARHNFSIDFDSLIELKVVLPLRAIYTESGEYIARCYDLNVTIGYNNGRHDGAIPVTMRIDKYIEHCNNQLGSNTGLHSTGIYALNVTVIVFCTMSTILCIRSIYRALLLCMETKRFFERFYGETLGFGEKMEFLDLWIVMICLNDLMIISGTFLKIRIETFEINSFNYTNCSLFLGVGNLLVWVGLLRYLSYFNSYNILVLTLKSCIFNVIRFIFCAFLIYCGFCFCGWVVLGPHHLKFRTLSSTSETLFSLMNGDDMFATFFMTDVPKNTIIWWFSRFYLYLFICLFIYVIVSLAISIILDAYESVSSFYKNKQDHKSKLRRFIEEYSIERFDRTFHNNSIVDQIQHYFSHFLRV